jgi:FOG: TPR repeat, SEL1 subfamily
MKRLTIILILFTLLTNGAAAQMTRGQLLRKYYQITQLHNSGKDAEAIALCEEITAQYPKLPDTYLRMAQIYDEGGESEMALVMYRTYASLEMNDKKLAEIAPRMKELEQKLGTKSFEQQEQEAFEKLLAETAAKEQEKVPEQIIETSQPAFTSSATSLFDLSTLITSANTKEPEPESEDEPQDQSENRLDASPEPEGGQEISLFDISAIDFNAATAQQDAPILEPEPEPEPEITQEIQLEADDIFNKASAKEDKPDCNTPYLFSQHPDIIDGLRLKRDGQYTAKVTPKRSFDSKSDLIGKWVSSVFSAESGREFVILNIDQMGNSLSVMINEESGLFLDKRNSMFKTSWNAVKSIWSSDGADFDASELIGCASRGDYSEESFDFTFSLRKKDKPNVATIGRDIMDGLSLFIPFGGLASRIGSTLLNFAGRKISNEKFQTTINFSLKSVTENVLACSYIVSEKHTSADGSRDMVIEERSFHMFRVPDSYKPYSYSSNVQENALYRAMYTKLEKESLTDPDKLFPLAYMSYYGVGMGKKADELDRLSKAVVQMQKLADNGCLRASAWLIPVYYNLSIDEKHYPMRIQRKKFRDLSDQQMSTMLMAYNPYVYGLNGDILASGNSDPEEIAAEYEKGAEEDDAYSLYRLGMAYKEGVIKSRDLDKSLECLHKSAEKGYADAYWQLALAYKSGLGVSSDYNQYIHMLFRAIDAGSIEAVDELSVAYFWGIGVNRDVDMAQQARRSYFYLKNNVWRDVLSLYGFPNI